MPAFLIREGAEEPLWIRGGRENQPDYTVLSVSGGNGTIFWIMGIHALLC